MALKHEAVTNKYNALVIGAAGRGKQVLDKIETMIKQENFPGVYCEQRDVSSGIFGEKRKFLVVGHNSLRDYKMYIGARDYGKNLDVSWYFTIAPGFIKRNMSKYMAGNPQALSMQIDFFTQQDLNAYTSFADYAVKTVTEELERELGLDPARSTKSKGFLERW